MPSKESMSEGTLRRILPRAQDLGGEERATRAPTLPLKEGSGAKSRRKQTCAESSTGFWCALRLGQMKLFSLSKRKSQTWATCAGIALAGLRSRTMLAGPRPQASDLTEPAGLKALTPSILVKTSRLANRSSSLSPTNKCLNCRSHPL